MILYSTGTEQQNYLNHTFYSYFDYLGAFAEIQLFCNSNYNKPLLLSFPTISRSTLTSASVRLSKSLESTLSPLFSSFSFDGFSLRAKSIFCFAFDSIHGTTWLMKKADFSK